MPKIRLVGALAMAIGVTISAPAYAQGGRLRAFIAGTEVPASQTRSVVVGGDVTGIDMASVVIERAKGPVVSLGDALDVEGTGGSAQRKPIFKGEVVGVEPEFSTGGETRLVIRAFNTLHRLTRGRKTRTFEKQSDADIASAIAREAGLGFGLTGPEASLTLDHVFQNNQTDLEFLRVRAARIGYEVWVDDDRLNFQRQRDPDSVSLACPPVEDGFDAHLNVFHPRMSSAHVVKKVTVRGWDPEKKEEIDAEATRPTIPLSPAAAMVTEPPGPSLDLGLVMPLGSVRAAYGAAHGTLAAMTALDLSAEADTGGSASLHAGAKVLIEEGGSPFDGKYLITAAQHRYNHESGEGWHTRLRLVREDRAVFLLPEVGDEVLVAFEHGDISRPYVVGSLWNATDPVNEAPFCGPLR